jgi:tetratricopeptide (TPR) repeat protein
MGLLRSWGLSAATAAAVVVTTAVAVGQAPAKVAYPECTKKPTAQDVEGAKGAHKAATQFYERAEYEKAISYWNDAYNFDCTAKGLLLNIANAYEKLGDRAATIATLEAYLRRTGPNPDIELKIKNLKLLMAAAQPTATAAPTAPTAAPSSAPTSPPGGARPYGFTPWILVGGGGALAIVGAILLPVGYGAISNAEKICPDHATCTNPDAASQGNSGRTQAGVGWGMLSVGLAAAGGGLVWQLLFNKPADPAKKAGVWMSPVAGPGAAGVSVGGRF